VGVIYFSDGYSREWVVMVAVAYMVGVMLFLCCYRRNAKR